MRTEYLREFLAVASSMSFTAAAKRLYMSQPKMSMHIASVEEELGFRLFDREGGLSLTREGRLFYERVSELLDGYDALVQECRDMSRKVVPSVVFGEFSMIDVFPQSAVARFRRAVADLVGECELVSRSLDNALTIAESFERGLCDVSFRTCCMEKPVAEVVELGDGMSVVPLEMDPMVALVRAGHPLSRLGHPLTPREVAVYPVVLSSLPSMETYNTTRLDFFAAHECRPRYQTRSVATPSSLVLSGCESDAVVLVASSYAQSSVIAANAGVEVLEMGPTTAQSCFCLCFPTDTPNAAVRRIAEMLCEHPA